MAVYIKSNITQRNPKKTIVIVKNRKPHRIKFTAIGIKSHEKVKTARIPPTTKLAISITPYNMLNKVDGFTSFNKINVKIAKSKAYKINKTTETGKTSVITNIT